jgi:hypothetical protein
MSSKKSSKSNSNSKSSKKTFRKTFRKTFSKTSSKTAKNRQNKVNIQYYSNMSDVFKYSTQRKFMKSFLEENKKHNLLSKYPFVEMTACIFAEFKASNMKLVSAVSNDPTLFFKNTENAVGKYYKDINPIDLYFTSIICACAYKNDVLIGLIVTLLNDENIDGNMIRNILNTLLVGYIPKNKIMQGGNEWGKIIISLIFISNLIYFLLQCNHFYFSTRNLVHEMKEGKTVTLIHKMKDISENSDVLKQCIQYNDVNPVSNTGKLADMAFSKFGNEVYNRFSNLNAVYNCLEDPIITAEIVKKSQWTNYVNLAGEEEIIIQENEEEKSPVYPIIQTNYDSTMPMDLFTNTENPLEDFKEVIPYIELLDSNTKEVIKKDLNDGLNKILEKAQTKKTYKELLEYFNELEEPENDDLARQLLNDDYFLQYKIQEDERRKNFKKMSGIVIKDTSYIGTISIITGAVKEVFWSSYSHLPLLDIITSIRNKINEYVRMIRTKYNAYNDLITDVTSELGDLSKKTETAINQFFNILASGTALGFQILGISFYGCKLLLDMKRGHLPAIGYPGRNRREITFN